MFPLHYKDLLREELNLAADLVDGHGIVGYGIVELFDERGRLKELQGFHNLITDAGDLYVAGKIITLIPPANAAAPTAANGMKLGTGATAVAKAGAGGALVTYKTASNVAFDATYPQTANLGAGLGVNSVYKTTWIAGVATDAALAECVIVNDQATNATTTVANTYSRFLFASTINKGASDSLAVTWNWKALGV